MTSHPVNVSTDKVTGERYYEYKGVAYPSVTTILSKGVVKGSIGEWRERLYREKTIEHWREIRDLMDQGDEVEVQNLLKEKVEDEASIGRSIGSQVHGAIEAEIISGTRIEIKAQPLKGFMDSYHRFLDTYQPKVLMQEFVCINTKYGYAGRGDVLLWTEEFGTTFTDWKTTRAGRHGHGIYPETALQLTGYSKCDLIVDDEGNELPMPELDGLLGINLRPRSGCAVPIPHSEDLWKYFRAILKSSEWANGAGFKYLGRKQEF